MKNRIIGVFFIGFILLAFVALSKPGVAEPVEAQEPFRVIGYVTSWSGSLNEVDFNQLTHINYAFLLPSDNGDGSLKPLDNPAKLQQLVSMAHANNVKVLISVGGWNDGNDQGFEILAAVLLDEQYQVQRGLLLPADVVRQKVKPDGHTNSHILRLTDALWDLPEAKDVTSELQATLEKL